MPITVDQLIGNPTVVAFAANANVQQQLQNNYTLEYLAMRLAGTLTLSGYTTNPSKYVESLENLVALFQLQATGNSAGATTDMLCNVDLPFLRFKTRMMEGTDVTRTDIGTGNGTYAFETNVKKYFVDPRSNASRLTQVFTAYMSSLTAAFQFRDATAMVYGGVAGAAALSNVQVTTQARMVLGLTPPSPTPYVRETQRLIPIAASQPLMPDLGQGVPVGQVIRRQYFKGLLGPVNFADPSDSVFGAQGKPEGPHIQLVINNQTVKLDAVYQQIRALNKQMFGVEVMPTGYAIYEPAGQTRKLAASLAMGNVAQAHNLFDVSFTSGSTNGIQITDEQIIGLSTAQYTATR